MCLCVYVSMCLAFQFLHQTRISLLNDLQLVPQTSEGLELNTRTPDKHLGLDFYRDLVPIRGYPGRDRVLPLEKFIVRNDRDQPVTDDLPCLTRNLFFTTINDPETVRSIFQESGYNECITLFVLTKVNNPQVHKPGDNVADIVLDRIIFY